MVRYVLELTSGFRLRLSLGILAGILRVGVGLVFVSLSKLTVDIAIGHSEGGLMDCIIGLVGCLVVELACSAFVGRNMELTDVGLRNSIQRRLYRRLLLSVWNGKEYFHSGDALSRLTEDCRVAADSLCRIVPLISVALVQLLGAFLFLWHFSHTLALLLFLILPVFILSGKLFVRKVRRLTNRIRNVESRLQGEIQESLRHRLLLLSCRQTLRAVSRIERLHLARYRLIRRRTDITAYSKVAVLAGFEAGYLSAFLWGIFELKEGTVSFGLMTAYLQLAGMIQRPMAEIARLLPALIQSHTAFSRLESIERLPAEEECPDQSFPMDPEPAGISFRDVSFSYPVADRPVFRSFSHTFAPGTMTAVMGDTGVGKSTLLRLVLAFLKPQGGEILLFRENSEGVVLSDPVSVATRHEIVYVPQGNTLFSGTIRENMRLGNPDATEEKMAVALHTAAADFVTELGNGLDTLCGENGEGLSEGQAQRIAIARALLRPGKILLLDEISASLDEATESLLLQRLKEKCSHHTILLVTHRQEAIHFCDDVVRLRRPV